MMMTDTLKKDNVHKITSYKDSRISLYADDTALYCFSNSLLDIILTLGNKMETVGQGIANCNIWGAN